MSLYLVFCTFAPLACWYEAQVKISDNQMGAAAVPFLYKDYVVVKPIVFAILPVVAFLTGNHTSCPALK